ncbi:MAG: REP-associated tyrosine transposase [Dehalococcoidia bacterium]
MAKLRTSPRLKDFDYVGPFAYSLSLVTRKRARTFTNPRVVQAVLDCLTLSCARYAFSLHAYCFMPDHLHLPVSGRDESSLLDFIRHFKQLSGHRYKREHGAQLWQISYHDHVLRRDEDLLAVARYIWDNPVRAGLVQDGSEYPFSGPKPTIEQA